MYKFGHFHSVAMGFSGGPVVKNLPVNPGDERSILWSGRYPRERNGSPLQCSYLRDPMDRGAWWAIAHGVRKSLTQLSD